MAAKGPKTHTLLYVNTRKTSMSKIMQRYKLQFVNPTNHLENQRLPAYVLEKETSHFNKDKNNLQNKLQDNDLLNLLNLNFKFLH